MTKTSMYASPPRARTSKTRGSISILTSALLALGVLMLGPVVAQAAEVPGFSTEVTEVANEKIDIAITGSGYGDVQALPGQTEPHAYFTLIEKGSDLSTVGEADTAISATINADGTVSDTLSVPAADLDRTKSYEVISWPSRSFPTEGTLYARGDITIDWDALFPTEEPELEVPGFSTEVTEVANEKIDIAITGSGYGDVQALPGQTEPHAYFTLIEKGSDLSTVGEADTAISATINADGTVSDTLSVPAADLDRTKSYEVISWPSRSFPTEGTLYARGDITIDWDALFPTVAVVETATELSTVSEVGDETKGIEFVATVSPATAPGEVTFTNNGEEIGTVAVESGVARVTTDLVTGDNRILAAFSSDDDGYSDSVSQELLITVSVDDHVTGVNNSGTGNDKGSDARADSSKTNALAVTGADGLGAGLLLAGSVLLLGAGLMLARRRQAANSLN